MCTLLQINLMKPILARDRAGDYFPAFVFKSIWLKLPVMNVITWLLCNIWSFTVVKIWDKTE